MENKSTTQQRSDVPQRLLASFYILLVVAFVVIGYFTYQNFQLRRSLDNQQTQLLP